MVMYLSSGLLSAMAGKSPCYRTFLLLEISRTLELMDVPLDYSTKAAPLKNPG